MVGRDQYHISVLPRQVMEYLKGRKGEWFLDATLGDGGYSVEILKKGGKIVGVDVDPQALLRSKKRFEDLGIKDGYKLVRGNFRDLNILKQTEDLRKLQFKGAILDLGVSSLQLDSPERGFSFGKEAPLDMRMDPDLQVKALDLVNGLNKGELYELFNKLGEEKYYRAITDSIIVARGEKRLDSTKQLADLIVRVYRRRSKKGEIHPATRVFQALRIAVNDELNALKEGLPGILEILGGGGTVVVISFHSLEDRIVKNLFREWEERGLGEILTKKPVMATDLEVEINPRSRSAKLRAFRKK